MSHVGEILKSKGNVVWSVTPETKLSAALLLMKEKNIGAVLVQEGEKIAGVFSERDFSRHATAQKLLELDLPVKNFMSRNVLCISSAKTIEECMTLMTVRHVRHLPVIDEGKLTGIISIGDVVSRVIAEQKFSLEQLENYVSGKMY